MNIPLVFSQAQTPERIQNITNDISRRNNVVSIKFSPSAWSAMITMKNPVDPNFTNEAVYNNPLLDQLRPVTIITYTTSNTINSETSPPLDSTNTTNSEAAQPETGENTNQTDGANTMQVVHSEEVGDSEREPNETQVQDPSTTDTNVTESTTLKRIRQPLQQQKAFKSNS